MSKSRIAVALTLAASGLGSALAGCTAPHPYIRDGNANSVEITYSGDVASTLALATKHCSQFERVPRLADTGMDFAIYDCVRR
jgi:hypothetical protein